MSYFQSEKLFQKLKQIQFEGDAFSFMNFRIPDLKKGDVMNAQGGQIVSILAILFLYTNVFTII